MPGLSAPGASSASGPTVINVGPVIVQGQVVTMQSLADGIWRALLEKGTINGTGGQLVQVR